MKRLLLAAMLVSAAPLAAEETPADDLAQETANLNAQAARDNAAAAATTASTARLQAQMDALGLPEAEGKTSLGTNAGLVEAWMLSSSTLNAAARWIGQDLSAATLRNTRRDSRRDERPEAADPNSPPLPPTLPGRSRADRESASDRSILLVAVDDPLVLDVAEDLTAQIAAADTLLDQATPAYCKGKPFKDNQTAGGGLPLAAIGAAVNLLKTDTEISGLDVPVAHRMLVAATGRGLVEAGHEVILPGASIATPERSVLAQAWGDLVSARNSAKECRERFAKEKKTPWLTKKLAAFDSALGAVDSLEGRLLKRDDKGLTPLAQAVRAEALLEGDPMVLRVAVEKAGGSILKRSNVWTALGAPAIGITGALIISYTLTEPRGGRLVQSGSLVCRTALTDLRAVQDARVRISRKGGRQLCSPSILD